ncbi:hypothetical protein [Novosphingobium sp.]|uniref:hypothetical protein n=1 Tax=Novosphingobium sp. TaxID=1874826 RepID=UPI0025E23387|nr:hypothetical protein [Novosphingobium sp.]
MDTIPTLRQVLDQIAGQVPVLIEIKSQQGSRGRVSALCLAVRRVLEGYQLHAVMSFDPRVVRWFADHSPLTVRGLVVTEEDDKALPGMVRRRLALWHARPDFAYDVHGLRPVACCCPQSARPAGDDLTVKSAEHRERASAHADALMVEGAGVQ